MASRKITEDEMRAALAAYEAHGGIKELAARSLGLAPSTYRGRLRAALRAMGESMVKKPEQYKELKEAAAQEPLHIVEKTRYEAQIERLNARVRELQDNLKESITHDELRRHIYKFAEQPTRPPLYEPVPRTGSGYPGVPVAMLSDLHYGETVSLKQMGGTNKFDVDIAESRLHEWRDTLIDLCFKHETWQGGYPGLVLCLGGDMISGDIHKELAETNALPTLSSVLRLAGVLEAHISALADKFGNVVVPCVTGNHGRMTHKPQAKDYNDVNFETLLYLHLENAFRLKGDERVRFIFPNDTLVHFSVYGYNYALTHGNLLGVKGGDGIIGPIGPITRGVHKLIASEGSKPDKSIVDYVIMGHWHTAMRSSNTFVNGSLKGFDEYARTFLRARFERPGQIMWFTHPEHGAVKFQVIYADKDMAPHRKQRKEQNWFECNETQTGHWTHEARGSKPEPS